MKRFIGPLCLLVLILGCAVPSPTPTPTPTPDELFFLSEEVRLYLIQMRPYASSQAIVLALEMSAASLRKVLIRIEAIVPPAELEEAHVKLVKGYQCLYEGRAILETHPRPELRSEGFFLQDWGIKNLQEYQEMILEYVLSQRLK